MGIFDLNYDGEGQPLRLEVNPQGQFLFMEGLARVRLTEHFGAFLDAECRHATSRRS